MQIDRKFFYDNVRVSLFNGSLSAPQFEGCEAILNAIEKHKVPNRYHAGYILATAYHEVGRTMQPVREGFTKTDAGAIKAVNSLFDRGIISRNYAALASNGFSYFGRGYVQLTWEENYIKLGKRLGIDLHGNPSLALDPKIAAEILVVGMVEGLFAKDKRGNPYKLSSFAVTDYKGMRRIVNGTDKADKIASYAYMFVEAIRPATSAVIEEPATVEPVAKPSEPVYNPTSIWDRLGAWFRGLFS